MERSLEIAIMDLERAVKAAETKQYKYNSLKRIIEYYAMRIIYNLKCDIIVVNGIEIKKKEVEQEDSECEYYNENKKCVNFTVEMNLPKDIEKLSKIAEELSMVDKIGSLIVKAQAVWDFFPRDQEGAYIELANWLGEWKTKHCVTLSR